MFTREIMIDALKQRCRYEYNLTLNYGQRWFYTVKAFLCFLFRLHNVDRNTTVTVSRTPQGLMPKTKYGSDDLILLVGYGYWRNWYAYLLDDRYTEFSQFAEYCGEDE